MNNNDVTGFDGPDPNSDMPEQVEPQQAPPFKPQTQRIHLHKSRASIPTDKMKFEPQWGHNDLFHEWPKDAELVFFGSSSPVPEQLFFPPL